MAAGARCSRISREECKHTQENVDYERDKFKVGTTRICHDMVVVDLKIPAGTRIVSHNPPLLSISFNLGKRPKDSRENILSTKQFTVNIISEQFVEAANITSVEAPASVDEWKLSGLTMEPSVSDSTSNKRRPIKRKQTEVKPAMVKESHISMECELHFSHNITALNSSEVTNTLVLGLIKRVHVRNSVLTEDASQVDPDKLSPVSRLGGLTYARLGDSFDLARPSWKAMRETIEKKD
ncbi:hypothetical protein VKT23_006835 [Stygiomarasmius scandens]|uniref:Flavin reductase like domain-containing protein n=1 Tax=Marasmiellus scandens TaxID=2682957 RepID=A0ABR1JNU7_9AGAR